MADKQPDHAPISSEDVPWESWGRGERFGVRYRHLTASRVGRDYRVGVAIEELEPGRQTAPFHYHMLEEEHVLLLEGELTLRLGEERFRMKAGDYVCFPAGRKLGHCLINEGIATCRYVIIGENNPHEVSVYPDSNKVQVRWLDERYDRAAKRDYWDGEDAG
jgi:uncharacterized cupin superfamily protein